MSRMVYVLVILCTLTTVGCTHSRWSSDFDEPPEFLDDPTRPHLPWWGITDEVFLGLSYRRGTGVYAVGVPFSAWRIGHQLRNQEEP